MTNLSTMDNFTCSCCHLVTCFVGECGTFFFFLSHLQVLFHTLGWFNRIYRLIFLARHLFHVQLLTQNSSRHFPFKDNEKWNLRTTDARTLMLQSIWRCLDFSSCATAFLTFGVQIEIFQLGWIFVSFFFNQYTGSNILFWQYLLWFLFKHFNTSRVDKSTGILYLSRSTNTIVKKYSRKSWSSKSTSLLK